MNEDFVHLNFQSEYSTLDSTCSLKQFSSRMDDLGFQSAAITDVCNVRGTIKFYKHCTQADNPIKPILGSKILIDESGEKYPLIVLAKDNDGFQNLRKLSHDSQTIGFDDKGKATTDFETLKKYAPGLICISTDLNGSVNKLLRRDKVSEAYAEASRLKDVFGDDYYLEVQKNDQLDQDKVNKNVFEISKKLGSKVVATNDIRYYEKDHYEAYLVLRANKKHTSINNKRFSELRTDQRFYKTYAEMRGVFKDYPDEIFKNTVSIAEQCNVTFEFGGMVLPDFELGEGYTDDWEYLKHLAFKGLAERGFADRQDYIDRLEEELFDVRMVFEVKQYNFARYFLMVGDYVNAAIERGCRVGVGRGCFKPHSLVDCATGQKRIDEVSIGDSVLSYDGKYHEVLNTLEYAADEDLYEIELDDGRVIECTDNHEIHVERDGELVWVRADELTLEDEIYDIRKDN